jgi:hypothetical protein
MAFPFSVRPLMAAWNGLFHDAQPFVPEPDQSAEWNRGAYLVNGLGGAPIYPFIIPVEGSLRSTSSKNSGRANSSVI